MVVHIWEKGSKFLLDQTGMAQQFGYNLFLLKLKTKNIIAK